MELVPADGVRVKLNYRESTGRRADEMLKDPSHVG